MQSKADKTDIDQLSKLLVPMLSLEGIDQLLVREFQDFLEGASLPSVEFVTQSMVPKDDLEPFLADTLSWIRTVVRPEWLIPNLEKRLLPVPEAIDGHDAFIGAWTKREHTFQIIVTEQKFHLVVNMVPSHQQTDDADKTRAAIQLAGGLMQLPAELRLSDWEPTPLGKLIVLNSRKSIMNPLIAAAIWYETLTMVTDGSATKYSVFKNMSEDDPPQSDGPNVTSPWFPREGTAAQ